MLRRRSTKSRSHINHHKPASCADAVVCEHHDSILAQRDAHIAALQAFLRAQNRASAMDNPLPSLSAPEPQRRHCQTHASSIDQAIPGRRSEGDQNHSYLQSVRFMGPQPILSGDRASRKGPSLRRSKSLGPDTTCAKGNREGKYCSDKLALSPPKRNPPLLPAAGLATNYLSAMEAQEEYYTPKDDVASEPSSFRRLRKSRSAAPNTGLGSLANRGILGSQPTVISRSRRLFRSDPTGIEGRQKSSMLRTPKSMSFLNRHSRLGWRETEAGSLRKSGQPEQAGLNGNEGRFLRGEHQNWAIKNKASMFFSSRHRRPEKGVRHALPNTSDEESRAQSKADTRITLGRSNTFKLRARRGSRSLKDKIKNLFTMGKSEGEQASIPCQHIESKRTHGFGTSAALADTAGSTYTDESTGSVRRVHTRVPSVQRVSNEIASIRASLESSRNEQGRKASDSSSLTSWVHSGPSTLTSEQQEQWRDWERQRLAAMGETVSYVPSSSIGSAAFRTKASQRLETSQQQALPARPIVDSERVYSALMKHMKAMNSCGNTEESGVGHGEDDTPKPRTIRRVISEREHGGSPRTVYTPTRVPRTGGSMKAQSEQKDEQDTNSLTSGVAAWNSELRRIPSGILAGSGWASKTADSPASHLFRRSDSYRRTLRASMQEEQNVWAQQSVEAEKESDADTPFRHDNGGHGDSDSDADKSLYSESVYSAENDEHRPVRPGTEETPTAYRPGGQRGVSDASSIDWKMWLSANLGKFDPTLSPSKQSEVEFALPSMPKSFRSGHFASGSGHVREHAQIHGEDEDHARHQHGGDDVFTPPAHKPTLPMTPLKQVQPNVAKPSPLQVKKKTSTPNGSASGDGKQQLMAENERPGANGHGPSAPVYHFLQVPPPLPPPPIPPRSKLRPSPLRLSRVSNSAVDSNVRKSYGAYSVTSSPGLTEAVLRQFGPVAGGNSRLGEQETACEDERRDEGAAFI